MRDRRNRPLQVEALESMTLLSGVAASAAMYPGPAIDVIPLPVIVSLDGATAGKYTSVAKNPDVPTTYTVNTHGPFVGYGVGTVTGSFHSGGFINKPSTGTLLVTLKGGTVTLALTSIPSPASSPSEFKRFTFEVVKGTGKFHNSVGDPVGKGVVAVFLQADDSSTLRSGHGKVTLVFHSIPVAIA